MDDVLIKEKSEQSVSLSFSDGPPEMHLFDKNNTMENQKTDTISPATLNRKSIVNAAPSLMKLLSIGNDSQNNVTSDFVPLKTFNETTNNNHDDQKELVAKATQEFEIL
eukprot:383934_1